MKKKLSTKQMVTLSALVAVAMILSYVESFVPSVVYGVKIGLPNIVIIYILYKLGAAKAAGVSIIVAINKIDTVEKKMLILDENGEQHEF